MWILLPPLTGPLGVRLTLRASQTFLFGNRAHVPDAAAAINGAIQGSSDTSPAVPAPPPTALHSAPGPSTALALLCPASPPMTFTLAALTQASLSFSPGCTRFQNTNLELPDPGVRPTAESTTIYIF